VFLINQLKIKELSSNILWDLDEQGLEITRELLIQLISVNVQAYQKKQISKTKLETLNAAIKKIWLDTFNSEIHEISFEL